jgi:hypothetical protein
MFTGKVECRREKEEANRIPLEPLSKWVLSEPLLYPFSPDFP